MPADLDNLAAVVAVESTSQLFSGILRARELTVEKVELNPVPQN